MTRSDGHPPPDPAGSDADALVRLDDRLWEERPVPAAVFRADLRRRLAEQSQRLAGSVWRPARPGSAVAGLLLGGCALMAVVVASVLGAGPLAP